MSTATQVARRYVSGNYGELVNVTDPQFDEEKREWEAELVSYYPRIIQDDAKPSDPFIKFVYLQKLGKVKLDENLNVLFATSRSACSNLVEERFSLFRQKAEKIMIEASAINLAGLVDAQHVLEPVVKVIDNLLSREAKIPEIKDSDFEERDNINRYWDFLEKAGIVVRMEGGYSSGPEFIRQLAMFRNNYELLVQHVLGHLIQSRYSSLRSVFEISELEPDIHIDSSYYWPALEADDEIHLKTDSLRERFITTYNKNISTGRFVHYLQQLQRVDALKQETNGWVAVHNLFAKMREIRGNELTAMNLRV